MLFSGILGEVEELEDALRLEQGWKSTAYVSETLWWASYVCVSGYITTNGDESSLYPESITHRYAPCHGSIPEEFTISCGPTQQKLTPGRLLSTYLSRDLLIGFPELDNDPHFFSDVYTDQGQAPAVAGWWADYFNQKISEGERVGGVSTLRQEDISGGLAATSTNNKTTLDENAIPAIKPCWQPQQLQPAIDHTIIGFVLHGRQLLATTHDAADQPTIATFDALRPNRWNVPVGWKYSILRGNSEVDVNPAYPETQAIWGYPELVLDLDHWPAVHAKEPDALTIFHKRLAQARANLQHPLD